ncbi:FtsK/SpoIIIE domain-containing protein [Actinomycetospora soli]|uniref:FtsK/SpoIIIE domain-containing protein n=1 Tax=Actinomycetospora soli TaxID=2893887 RepID=UPI001E4A4667|nr:FtsK/SpoIIIE domain-containing protein [Actinomycetospora soli]MCD2191682.1 hypothetical protein [Actinomycetospora soli]
MALFPWRTRPRDLTGRHSTRYDREVPAQRRTTEQEWRALWRDTAEGLGLAHLVHVAAGVTVSVPRVGGVTVDSTGRVCRATIQRRPGQRTADYRALAVQLADALGCARVRIEDMSAERWIVLHLLDVDPLATTRGWAASLPAGFIARDEEGRLFSAPWQARPHTIAQGSTGSGKSSWVYSQLAPLAGRRDVRVAGIDPSGVLLRPWPDDPWRVSGLGGVLEEHRRALGELCDEMDRRLTVLPRDTDNLATDEATPLLVVVLEEYAALVRAAELVDRKVGQEVRQRVGRLFSEGRKVGVRLLLVVQRADTAIVDGAIRAQATLRVSFASEADGIRMLHPADAIDPDEHSIAAPGVCAITAPRVGTFRARSTLLGYRDYCAAVRAGIER